MDASQESQDGATREKLADCERLSNAGVEEGKSDSILGHGAKNRPQYCENTERQRERNLVPVDARGLESGPGRLDTKDRSPFTTTSRGSRSAPKFADDGGVLDSAAARSQVQECLFVFKNSGDGPREVKDYQYLSDWPKCS
jgi:hypothetical protein